MVGALLTMVCLAAQPELPQVERVSTTRDAVGLAIADVAFIPAAERPFLLWLWIPPGHDQNENLARAVSFAVNAALSRSSSIKLPAAAGGGRLIRWNLRELAPKDEDLAELVRLRDDLAAIDPYFHARGNTVRVQVAPYRASDGKTYDFRLAGGTVAAPHLAAEHDALERLLGLDPRFPHAPILRADWFLVKLLSTLEGGVYYRAVGFAGKNEAEILQLVGAEVALSRQVEGDDRVGIFESGITGKARTVEAGQGAVGPWWITYDLFDEDSDAARHPIYNLLGFVDRARGKEIIFARANGLHGFLAVNGAGQLVDSVPENIAADHEIPAPHTRKLQPAIGCIRCHGAHDGLQPVANDVATLLRGRLDVFDDLGNLRAGRIENVDRLAGLYAGDFGKRLRLGRDDYSDAVFRATRGLDVPVASKLVADVFGAYRFAKVTPDQAALEIGLRVKAGGGAVALTRHVPDLVAGGVVIEGKSLAVEDPAVAALKQGMSVRRVDWERVIADVELRMQRASK